MNITNIVVIAMVIILMSAAIWLVQFAAKAVQDQDNDFGELEFSISAMGLVGSAITVSYFAIVYVVMAPEPAVTQSSHIEHYTSMAYKNEEIQ